jgi:hypothetical protein
MNQNLIKEFEKSTSDLLQALNQFTNEQFNMVPFEGSWTAGQVAEHLFKSESNAVRVVNGSTRPTIDRNPEANEEVIRSMFLDYTAKFQSPDFILPSEAHKKRDVLLKGFEKTRDNLRKMIENEDLSLTCMDFSFPGVGEMTRQEWLCFVNCHTIRHTRQLKNIYEKLEN